LSESRHGISHEIYKTADGCYRDVPPVDLFHDGIHALFYPPLYGGLIFNTCVPVAIDVERIGVFDSDYGDPAFSLAALIPDIQELYEKRLA
jgi:hypothetical protein